MKVDPLSEGKQIPNFETRDETGTKYNNKTIKGKLTLIYFYPRDSTPSCTIQACEIRDSYEELLRIPLQILAFSTCSLISHQKFKSKFSLPFPLLLDEKHKIAESFGVWGEKKFMGKTFEGIHRTSFLVSKSGKILKTYRKVKPILHISKVMQDIIKLTEE